MERLYLIPLAVLLALNGFVGCGTNNGINVNINGNGKGIRGSGDLVTLELDLADFTRINLSHTAKATISQSDQFRVVVRLDDNITDRLRINRNAVQVEGNAIRLPDQSRPGDRLEIGLENGSYNNITLEVEIALPDLRSLELSGAARAAISDFAVDRAVEFDLSGASHLSGSIDTGALTCRLSGASSLSLSGSGSDLSADASGASNLQLGDFTCRDANIELSGASQGLVQPAGTLDAKLSGASSLRYKGNPTLGSVSTNGASSLQGGD